MTDHLIDAKRISENRIQELLDTNLDSELLYHGGLDLIITPDVSADIHDCLYELKALRQQQPALNEIAAILQNWLDFNADARIGPVNDDMKIMTPPVWPTRGTLKAWIAALQPRSALGNHDGDPSTP